MPKKLAENQTYVSIADAMQVWSDTEREYEVQLELRVTTRKLLGGRYTQYFCLSAYKEGGATERICVHSRGLEYPSNDAHTYPAALIAMCTRVWHRLEEIRTGKTTAPQQSGLFD